jgi:PAS domain-containing protein
MSETSEYPTSVDMLAAVLDALPVGVWIMDREGRITHGNPAGRRIWGGARYVGPEQFGEYRGWWTDTGKRIEPNEWAAARAIQKGETSLDEVIDIECFDGSRKTILNSALPVRGTDGRIVGAIIVNQDISLRRKAELEREGILRRL